MDEVVVVAAKRTAIGSFLGSLKNTKTLDMVSALSMHLIEKLKLECNCIDEVILGQVLQSTQGQNLARQVLLNCGIALDKTAYLVNMVCGSGLKALELAFDSIRLKNSSIILAGGVENMSMAPFALTGTRTGYKMGHKSLIDTLIHDGLWCALNDYHMGITAENLAKKYKISKEQQDEFALNSHLKATKAIEEGRFKEEIFGLKINDKRREFVFAEDEFVRRDASMEALTKLPPVFVANGSVSAGNSSGINDGAAMLILASKSKAKQLHLPILAYIKAFANIGVDPKIMGIGAAFAVKKLLEKTRLNLSDIDLFELNEAFAAQSLATLKEAGIDEDRVNVNGGAIALGHPIGASGARIVVSLIHALRSQKKNLGIASLCVGGGQGIAAVVEIKE